MFCWNKGFLPAICKHFPANNILHMRIVIIPNKWKAKLDIMVTIFLLFKIGFWSAKGLFMCSVKILIYECSLWIWWQLSWGDFAKLGSFLYDWLNYCSSTSELLMLPAFNQWSIKNLAVSKLQWAKPSWHLSHSTERCLVMITLAYLYKNTRKLADMLSLRDHLIFKGKNTDTIILFLSLIFSLKWSHLGIS